VGWVGLGWVGLGWVGLGWVGLGWVIKITTVAISKIQFYILTNKKTSKLNRSFFTYLWFAY